MMDKPRFEPRRPDESLVDALARYQEYESAYGPPQHDPELVPDAGGSYVPTPESLELDSVLGAVDIVEAYERFCGKMRPNVGTRRESIMVSCPNPAHPDANPSAWMTLDKGDGGVGTCALCEGFDKYTIFAWNRGYPVPGYNIGSTFTELREHMATELGFTVSSSGSSSWATPVAPEPAPSAPVDDDDGPRATVTHLHAYDDVDDDEDAGASNAFVPPGFDWRAFPAIQPETFLHTWLEETSKTTQPEEYYFWLGMMALGLVGNRQAVFGGSPPYRSNLMMCLVGPPAIGKSIAIGRLRHLLHEALPFRAEVGNTNPLVTSGLASGEALIDVFVNTAQDPASEEKVALPTTALIEDAELATILARAHRNGATLREVMQEFYDSSFPVSTRSRGGGHLEARDHYASFLTTTQHERLNDLLQRGDETSGFISRWLFCYGTAKRQSAYDAGGIDLAPSAAALRKLRSWTASPRTVEFRPPGDATDAWESFYYGSIEKVVTEATSSALARLPLLCRKLLLLFAINDRATTVLPEHVLTLERLWPYLLASYGVVHDLVSTPRMERLMQRIERTVAMYHERKDKWPTRREINRNMHDVEPRERDDAMKYLLSQERLIEMKAPTTERGGRPTVRYRLPAAGEGTPLRLP